MIDPRISLTPAPTINVGQRFAQSLQNVQRMQRMPFENQLLELQTELAQAQQPAQLMEAERAASPQTQAAMTQQQFNDFDVLTARALKPALDAGDAMATVAALTKQRQLAMDSGLPQSEIAEIDQAIQIAQTPEGLQGLKQLTDNVLMVSGEIPRQQSATASQRDFETFKALQAKADETGLDSDIQAANQFGRQSGFLRPTEQEKADIKVSEAEKKEIAKSNAKRKQGFIDAGVDAADGVANIKRSLELLKTVKTGGLDAAIFRAKQLFGVEGADEGELSANLGRAVLAQLKPIFGAAFTAAEGERLEKIEAGFGRNTETNIRLLNDVLKRTERAARRGLAAAEDQGDTFTADEIKTALATEIELPSVEQEPPEAQIEAQVSQFQEGQTATNPQTGQKIVFRNGQWVNL